jgi:hypothetical protein
VVTYATLFCSIGNRWRCWLVSLDALLAARLLMALGATALIR